MLDSEKQVEQLLLNANQSLNFLRKILDDLIYRKDEIILTVEDHCFPIKSIHAPLQYLHHF